MESQQALQKSIFQERCIELQAKLDKSRVAYYEKGRELEMLRMHFEEQKQKLLQLQEERQGEQEEKRTLLEKIADLEAEALRLGALLCRDALRPGVSGLEDHQKALHHDPF